MTRCNSETKTKDHIIYIVASVLVGITMISGLIITSFGTSAEATDAVDEINITVPTACTMGGTIVQGEEHATTPFNPAPTSPKLIYGDIN